MSAFQEMDPDLIRELLKDQEDSLKPLMDKEETYFRHVPCPECHSYNHQPMINAKAPFTPGAALPNKLLRCLQCDCEFDPYSGLITRASTT